MTVRWPRSGKHRKDRSAEYIGYRWAVYRRVLQSAAVYLEVVCQGFVLLSRQPPELLCDVVLPVGYVHWCSSLAGLTMLNVSLVRIK